MAATQGIWNVFGRGLGLFDTSQKSGTEDLSSAKSTLGAAEQYWRDRLTAGRTETAANAAPAINARLAQSDTARRQEGELGTGRTGGTAAINRESGTKTSSNVADIINENLISGRREGAQGLQQVAGQRTDIATVQLREALAALGLSGSAVEAIMNNATQSRGLSRDINKDTGRSLGKAFGDVLSGVFGL